MVTLAELELGVHLAASENARTRRLATLRALNETYVAVPIDEPVASAFAELVALARRSGRRLSIQHAWIAATAKAHAAEVYTQDVDFEGCQAWTSSGCDGRRLAHSGIGDGHVRLG